MWLLGLTISYQTGKRNIRGDDACSLPNGQRWDFACENWNGCPCLTTFGAPISYQTGVHEVLPLLDFM